MTSSNSALLCLAVTITLAAGIAFAYLLPGLESLWTSDDHALVPHLSERSTGSFVSSLTRSKHSNLTVHRLFTYSVIGLCGSWLSTPGVHLLAMSAHFLCGALAFGLVRRLFATPTPFALFGTLAFALAPWASQPVIWWSAICTSLSSIFILSAAHLFLGYLRSRQHGNTRHISLFTATSLAFLSLCFYDLWISGWLLFVAIAWIEQPAGAHVPRIMASLRRSLPMAIPFALWVGLIFALGPRGDAGDRVNLEIARIPVVFVSIHARVVHWLFDEHQIDFLLIGLKACRSIASPILLLSTMVGVTACFRLGKSQIAASSPVTTAPPITHQLLVTWAIFLSSRLPIVLQGGVALHSRLNYGAAIAVGMAVGSVLWWGYQRIRPGGMWRFFLVASTGCSLLAMGLTTLGRATHYAAVTVAEDLTISSTTLSAENLRRPDIKVFIVGNPVPNIGELNYFEEGNGTWLRYRLQQRTGRQVEVQLLPELSENPDEAIVLEWREGLLQERTPAQRQNNSVLSPSAPTPFE